MTITAPAPTRIAPARPTISVGGHASASLSQGLLALRVLETVEGLSSCEAGFGNRGARENRLGFLYFDRRTLDFGVALDIAVGGGDIFRGRVTALEGDFPAGEPSRITVLAEDRCQDLRMTRRTRTFADVTDADVMRKVAAEHGLTADVEVPGPKHRVLAQLNQSDLAFLRDRARAVEAELWTDGSTLFARPRAGRSSPPVTLGLGNELRELRVGADLSAQRTGLTVSGWDVAGKRPLAETAGESVIAAEVRGGESGPGTLSAVFGRRPESVVSTVPLNPAEAQARAETLFRRMARRFVSGRGVAEPQVRLRAGTTVRLEGLGELFSGEYYVTEVVHLFDDEEGLRTEFCVERAGLGGGSR
ncbi:phage late control D family protein [Streptomyces sp. NPDC059916]|uniref:phage late control D family protein n=1 Tax=Streptomyces sp. NPDC059916 TaxID=3347001 RepID=UPI00368BD206